MPASRPGYGLWCPPMSIVIAIVGLGLLIAAHEAGHLLLARLMRMRVETYSLGFGPRLWGFRSGETDYRVSALPLGGYCKIAGFTPDEPAAQDPRDQGAYMNKPAWRRALVIFAGPGVNYATAFVLIFALYVTRGFPDSSTTRIEVIPGGPAAAAGLATGDRVVSIDGTSIADFDSLRREMQKPGAPSVRRVEVMRAGEQRSFPVTPASNGTISVSAERVLVRVGAAEALSRAAHDVWALNAATLGALWDAVRLKGGASLSGPVGIVKQASQEVKRGLGDFAAVLASISVGLAVFNLLPVPALDGGRLVFLAGELATGRKVNPRLESAVNVAGMLLLLALLLSVVVFSDLGLARKLFPHS
jgi:regulator of sigma E protease